MKLQKVFENQKSGNASSADNKKTFLERQIDVVSIHRQFVQFGRERNKITYKLLVLLPRIYKQRIYQQKGYLTIYEYAGKLAGLSHSVVEKALNLDKHLENKPFLQKAIESQGVHKVALVAKLATPETDKAFADKVVNMSTSAIQTLSKELRQEAKISEDLLYVRQCQAAPTKMTIELDSEMQFLFLKLKKEIGKGLTNRDALKIMLKMLNERTAAKRSTKVNKNLDSQQNTASVQNFCAEILDTQVEILRNNKPCSRYIPAQLKREIINETQGMCSYPGCTKPAQIFHHTNRFSVSKNHESLITLCKDHHEFVHNGIIQKENSNPQNWQLNILSQPTLLSDQLFRKYRKVDVDVVQEMPNNN